MPLPFFPIPIMLAITLYGFYRMIRDLKGKRFAVLGKRDSGKTALIKYLSEGVFSRKYDPTVIETKTKRGIKKFEGLELILKESKDVAGDQGNWGRWKNVYLESDVVLYLFK